VSIDISLGKKSVVNNPSSSASPKVSLLDKAKFNSVNMADVQFEIERIFDLARTMQVRMSRPRFLTSFSGQKLDRLR
jgi:hypothetical protein